MINFSERTFPRVNSDPTRIQIDFVWEGVTFPHNRANTVDRPFRELMDFVGDQGQEMAWEEALAMSEMILELARDVYCPEDTGDLRNSAEIEENNGNFLVSFNTRYALYVHEDLTAYHEPPTCAKFLDKATAEVSQMFEQQGSFSQVGQDIGNVYIGSSSLFNTGGRSGRGSSGGGPSGGGGGGRARGGGGGSFPNFGQMSNNDLTSPPKVKKFGSLRKKARYTRLSQRRR